MHFKFNVPQHSLIQNKKQQLLACEKKHAKKNFSSKMLVTLSFRKSGTLFCAAFFGDSSSGGFF